ncbi:MAG TPA: heavy-metal-associated domain-containing protein [Gammaproteobacteria bacterium]|nr:heavy-metal-associated domain-containing protein [Gammaproteobacteria bacterium]
MKHTLQSILLITLLWSGTTLAAGKLYELRVDGMACAFCAYGIEKKFKKMDGVEGVDINLQKGLVQVKTREDKTFTKTELKKLIHDSGFTLKSLKEKPAP